MYYALSFDVENISRILYINYSFLAFAELLATIYTVSVYQKYGAYNCLRYLSVSIVITSILLIIKNIPKSCIYVFAICLQEAYSILFNSVN